MDNDIPLDDISKKEQLQQSIEEMFIIIQKDIKKLHTRLDDSDEKINEIHAVYKRISQETIYRQQHSSNPLYGAKYLNHTDIHLNNIDQQEEEEEEEDEEGDKSKNKLTICNLYNCLLCSMWD